MDAGEKRRAARAANRGNAALRVLEQPFELEETCIQLEQLGAPVSEEILPEAIAPVHLQHEAAEVAELLLSSAEERAALAPEDAGRRKLGSIQESGHALRAGGRRRALR
jgi:hypothetical protein